jgi:hypothetical protein
MSKHKVSVARKEYWNRHGKDFVMSEATKDKLRKSRTGKHLSDDAKHKVSIARKQYWERWRIQQEQQTKEE